MEYNTRGCVSGPEGGPIGEFVSESRDLIAAPWQAAEPEKKIAVKKGKTATFAAEAL